MTKRQMVDRIALSTGLPKLRLARAVDQVLDLIADTLAQDGRLELRDFGVFRTVHLPARQGRNPRTGAAVDVPAQTHVRFKAGKELRQKLNPETGGPS